jgi:hypothetical protein
MLPRPILGAPTAPGESSPVGPVSLTTINAAHGCIIECVRQFLTKIVSLSTAELDSGF